MGKAQTTNSSLKSKIAAKKKEMMNALEKQGKVIKRQEQDVRSAKKQFTAIKLNLAKIPSLQAVKEEEAKNIAADVKDLENDLSKLMKLF